MRDAPTVEIEGDELVLGPVRVAFERTLRIPEVGLHDLPPGLGRFPLRRVEDYLSSVPQEWLAHGGVMLPIFPGEAMWFSFAAAEPAALQVGVGKVCAVSGDPWTEKLRRRRQNYLALPDQPWLDGINAGAGYIRQFVAAPLGLGATVEAQVTGEDAHGGIQLRAVGATPSALEAWRRRNQFALAMGMPLASELPGGMGLGVGGRVRQEIYADERRIKDYDASKAWRAFVHLCSPTEWTAITGEIAPPSPVDRETYVEHGLPWFDYYDADLDDIRASETLARVDPLSGRMGIGDQPFTPVDPRTVITLKDSRSDPVSDGTW